MTLNEGPPTAIQLRDREPARRNWRHALDVVAVLVDRDLKMLYKRSWLGLGWALATPLLQLAVYSLVFRRVLSIQVENYASYAFSGVLVWGWFQSTLLQSTSLITGSPALVRQPGFPLAMLPYVTVGVRFVHFALALPVLFVFLWVQGIHPGWAWAALPLVAAVQFTLSVGLAYPLAALNVSLRDTQHVVGVALQLLMFLTPIFYSLDAVSPATAFWFQFNPLVGLLRAWRDVLLGGRWPDPATLAALGAAAVVLHLAGRRLFVAQSHRFVDDL